MCHGLTTAITPTLGALLGVVQEVYQTIPSYIMQQCLGLLECTQLEPCDVGLALRYHMVDVPHLVVHIRRVVFLCHGSQKSQGLILMWVNKLHVIGNLLNDLCCKMWLVRHTPLDCQSIM